MPEKVRNLQCPYCSQRFLCSQGRAIHLRTHSVQARAKLFDMRKPPVMDTSISGGIDVDAAPLEATADTDVEPAVRRLVCQYTMHAVLHKRKPPVEWQDPVPKRPRGGAARRQSYSAVQKSEFLSVRLPFAGPRRAEAVAHYTPGGFTEDCQPVDKGAGSNVQMYMSDELDKWLDCDENMEKWEVRS